MKEVRVFDGNLLVHFGLFFFKNLQFFDFSSVLLRFDFNFSGNRSDFILKWMLVQKTKNWMKIENFDKNRYFRLQKRLFGLQNGWFNENACFYQKIVDFRPKIENCISEMDYFAIKMNVIIRKWKFSSEKLIFSLEKLMFPLKNGYFH